MHVRVQEDWLDNDRFWKEYCLLLKKSKVVSVNLTEHWFKSYIKNYLKNDQVYIIAVYENDELIGCCPLQKTYQKATKYWSYCILRPLGNGPSDFYDFIILPGLENKVFKAIVGFFKKQRFWDKIDILNIPENSIGLHSFKQFLIQQKMLFQESQHSGAFYINTQSDCWETFEQNWFNKNNKDLLKSERRLEKDFIKLKLVKYSTNIYNQLIKNAPLYANRRSSLGQYNLYNDLKYKKFLKDVISDYEKEGKAEFHELVDENGIIWAFQLDWLDGGVRYHFNHAYNEDFKRYSPGKILLKKLMKSAFYNDLISACNHMRGLSSYKSKLANEKFYLVKLTIENPLSKKLKITKFISKVFNIIRA